MVEGGKVNSFGHGQGFLYVRRTRNKGNNQEVSGYAIEVLQHLYDKACHDDEMEKVDASKPRPRPFRSHIGKGWGPKPTKATTSTS